MRVGSSKSSLTQSERYSNWEKIGVWLVCYITYPDWISLARWLGECFFTDYKINLTACHPYKSRTVEQLLLISSMYFWLGNIPQVYTEWCAEQKNVHFAHDVKAEKHTSAVLFLLLTMCVEAVSIIVQQSNCLPWLNHHHKTPNVTEQSCQVKILHVFHYPYVA
jgi:hypothetical protein